MREPIYSTSGIRPDGAQELFVQETIARFDDIARLSAAGAYNDMIHEARSLKGTVGAVGADGLLQLLQLARDDMDAYIAAL